MKGESRFTAKPGARSNRNLVMVLMMCGAAGPALEQPATDVGNTGRFEFGGLPHLISLWQRVGDTDQRVQDGDVRVEVLDSKD